MLHEKSPKDMNAAFFDSIVSVLLPMLPENPVIPGDIEKNLIALLCQDPVNFMDVCGLLMRLRDAQQHVASHFLKVKGKMVFLRDARVVNLKESSVDSAIDYQILCMHLANAASNVIDAWAEEKGAAAEFSGMQAKRTLTAIVMEAYLCLKDNTNGRTAKITYLNFLKALYAFVAKVLGKSQKTTESMLLFERDLCSMRVETPALVTVWSKAGQRYVEVEAPSYGLCVEIQREFAEYTKSGWYQRLSSELQSLFSRWWQRDADTFRAGLIVMPAYISEYIGYSAQVYIKQLFKKEKDAYILLYQRMHAKVPVSNRLCAEERQRLCNLSLQVQLPMVGGHSALYIQSFLSACSERKGMRLQCLQKGLGADSYLANQSLDAWGMLFCRPKTDLLKQLLILSTQLLQDPPKGFSEDSAQKLHWLQNQLHALQQGKVPDAYFNPKLRFIPSWWRRWATKKKMQAILINVLASELLKHGVDIASVVICATGQDMGAAFGRLAEELCIFMENNRENLEQLHLFSLNMAAKTELESLGFAQIQAGHAAILAGGFSGTLGWMHLDHRVRGVEHARLSDKMQHMLAYRRWAAPPVPVPSWSFRIHSVPVLSKNQKLHALKLLMCFLDPKHSATGDGSFATILAQYMAQHRLHNFKPLLKSVEALLTLSFIGARHSQKIKQRIKNEVWDNATDMILYIYEETCGIISASNPPQNLRLYESFRLRFVKMHSALVERTIRTLKIHVDNFNNNPKKYPSGSARYKLALEYRNLLEKMQYFKKSLASKIVEPTTVLKVAALLQIPKQISALTEAQTVDLVEAYEEAYPKLCKVLEEIFDPNSMEGILGGVLVDAQETFGKAQEEFDEEI